MCESFSKEFFGAYSRATRPKKSFLEYLHV
jgi:hypothetical protein